MRRITFTVGCTAILAALAFAAPVLAQPAAAPGSEFQRGQQQMQAGRFDEAAESFREATEAEPSNARAWFLHAYALHASGRLTEAIPAHRRAAEFASQRPVALYNLGCAFAMLGRDDEAFAALEEAADAGGLDLAQWARDADLASLHDDPRWSPLLDRVRAGVARTPSRALRFWVGEWEVYNRQGIKVGDNSVTLRDNGRVIYESWQSVSGGAGESFNYFDPVEEAWTQVWVDARGNVLRMSGTFTDDALRFEGVAHHRDGGTALHRTTLTPLAGGHVRQFIEQSFDNGASWLEAVDFEYVPRGTPYGRAVTGASAVAPGVVRLPMDDGLHLVAEVRDGGDPAIVFVHGWGCERAQWDAQVAAFAGAHRVVALDLPGHGDSGTDRAAWSPATYAGDVATVVERLGLDRVILVGHSMGAPVSMLAAALMPERVIGVVAVDALHDVSVRVTSEMLEPAISALETDYGVACEQLARASVSADADPAIVERITAGMRRVKPDIAVELLRSFVSLDQAAALVACPAPVRCINAEAPRETKVEANCALGADFDAVTLGDVGHFPMLERPDAFNERLRAVIAELVSAAANE